jgi:hypothetical protein
LKKDRFCLFKITIQGVSLQNFHAYMYYNFNWFIPGTHIELMLKQGERLLVQFLQAGIHISQQHLLKGCLFSIECFGWLWQKSDGHS